MSLIVCEQRTGPITLLELGGTYYHRLDGGAARLIGKARAAGTAIVAVRLRAHHPDSLGIGALVRNWVSRRSRDGSLRPLRPSPRMREVLQIVGLSKLIESLEIDEDAFWPVTTYCRGEPGS